MTAPKIIKSYMDAIDGDEKFVITLGAGIVNTLLLIFAFLDMATYATLTTITVGAFIAGDVMSTRKANARTAEEA